MSQDYQDYNQQQGGWQDPNQQQQGGWQGPNWQQGQQQGVLQDPNQQQQQGQQEQGQDPFGEVKQMANQQIDSAIDQFASKIPGGQQYSQQAENRFGDLGGIFDGGNQGN